METEGRKRRGGLVGPVVLIGLGVVFLLNNLGMLDWNVLWTLLRLWPLLLVAAGIDLLIGRRSILGSLVALVLIVALLGGAFWLVWNGGLSSGAQDVEEISQPLEGATQATIELSPAVVSLHVDALPESSHLVQGVVHPGSGERVGHTFEMQGDSASFRLASEGVIVGPVFGMPAGEQSWDLGLNADVPLDVEVDFGLGLADLDMSKLAVENLTVEMGMGQTLLRLPVAGGCQVKVEGGMGQIEVVTPSGVEARITFDTGLVTRQLPPNYTCRNDVCTSSGYDRADRKVDLEIDMGMGSVIVR